MNRPLTKSVERTAAALLGSTRGRFGSDPCAPPSLSAAVAHPGRWATNAAGTAVAVAGRKRMIQLEASFLDTDLARWADYGT
jgi:hypothetical protein